MKSFFAIGLIVIFLCSVRANEQYAVRGTLYDFESFDPIHSAEITVLGTPMKVVTDKDGIYEIDALPQGKYDIQYFAQGYQKRITKEIHIEHDVTLNIALEKQGHNKPQDIEIKLDMAYFKKIEYPLKSSFLFKLSSCIQWQGLQNHKTFRIGVVGQLPEHGSIEIPKGKTIAGLPIEVVAVSDVESAKHCKVLFFTKKSDSKMIQDITDEIAGLEILTVSDTESAKPKSMMINLLTLETNLIYAVQQKNIDKSTLRYSNELFGKAGYINRK